MRCDAPPSVAHIGFIFHTGALRLLRQSWGSAPRIITIAPAAGATQGRYSILPHQYDESKLRLIGYGYVVGCVLGTAPGFPWEEVAT